MTNFERAVTFVLQEEGYGNHALPGDSGGLTIWGISARYFPYEVSEMAGMSQSDSMEYAKKFYRGQVWDAYKLEDEPWPMCLAKLDTAVNCGPGRMKRWSANNESWQQFLCNRVHFQIYISNSRYTVSLLNRIYRLFLTAKG